MIAYRIRTDCLYRKSLLLASDAAVQNELIAEARCNPHSAGTPTGDRTSVLKTAHEEVRIFGAERLEQRGEMKPANESELRQLRYRNDVVRTWPASERRDVTLAGIYYRLMILEMKGPK